MAIRILVLKPGECAILPKGAELTALIVDGDGQVTSTCDNLPEPSDYVCYQFFWEADSGGAPLNDAVFESLIIGDNVYTVPSGYNDYGNKEPLLSAYELYLGEWIDTDPALAGIVKFGCGAADGLERRLNIKIPEGVPVPKLKVRNVTGSAALTYFFIEATADGDCTDCT